jgi:hypothetical protein
MVFPEKGRLAAHVLIDGVVASKSEYEGAADLAYQRLNELDTIPVHVDGGDPEADLNIDIDLSNILGASLITISWLVEQLATETGRSRENILFALREYVDR